MNTIQELPDFPKTASSRLPLPADVKKMKEEVFEWLMSHMGIGAGELERLEKLYLEKAVKGKYSILQFLLNEHQANLEIFEIAAQHFGLQTWHFGGSLPAPHQLYQSFPSVQKLMSEIDGMIFSGGMKKVITVGHFDPFLSLVAKKRLDHWCKESLKYNTVVHPVWVPLLS